MKKRFRPLEKPQELRDKLIGLGESSLRKSYYPELQIQLDNLKERVQLAELVAEIGQALTEEPDLRSSLQRCSDALAAHSAAAFVRIWVLDEQGESLDLLASSGLHTSINGSHCRLSLKDYPHKVGIIAREKQPFLTNEVVGNAQFHNQEWVAAHGIVAFAGFPLMLQQRLVGVIALFSQQPLGETVMNTLESINRQLAVSIDRFQLLDAYKTSLDNAKASHEKVNGILRSVADALLVIDNQQHILHMNQAAEALLGTSLATANRKRVDEISRQPQLLDYIKQLEHAIPEEDSDLNLYDIERNEMRIIQARAAPLKGSHPDSGRVISLRDVTQEREVARMKSEFISTAAHELRTPLTSISGFTELLCEDSWSTDQQKEYLQIILEKAWVLEQIIDDLLDLSRIESGRALALNYSEWDISGTLHKLIGRYQTEYPDYRFDSNIEEGLGSIQADHGKLLQALENLLSNAIKYSAPGSLVLLTAQRNDTCLCLRVSDHGIGMTEEQSASCFDKFYRADSSNTAVGGLGLGLSIVRNVIEAHHGTIDVVSVLHKGTTITCTLPLRCGDGMGDERFHSGQPHPSPYRH